MHREGLLYVLGGVYSRLHGLGRCNDANRHVRGVDDERAVNTRAMHAFERLPDGELASGPADWGEGGIRAREAEERESDACFRATRT